MALTVTITKTSVTKAGMAGLFNANLTIEVADDGPGPGFTRMFSHSFKQAEAKPDLLATSIARMEPAFKADMNRAIDDYTETQAHLARKELDDLVTALQDSVQAGLEA